MPAYRVSGTICFLVVEVVEVVETQQFTVFSLPSPFPHMAPGGGNARSPKIVNSRNIAQVSFRFPL
jgi:hypothetical protein